MALELRGWQRDAIDQFFAKMPSDFLLSATPGAGKTAFACTLASRLLGESAIQRVMIVVPTDALRLQWADTAENYGLMLQPVDDPSVDYHKSGYHGCVCTYAQLAEGSLGADLARIACKTPTLGIIDEIHHAGDERAWGEGLKHALEGAVHRVALTGTPWRRDPREAIPFVAYENGRVAVDFSYEYGEAVADDVVRGIVFNAYEGEGRWSVGGMTSEARLGADLKDSEVGRLLDTVYDPSNEWMPSMLRAADRALDALRQEVPDAAGLVVAHRTWLADRYGDLLKDITGSAPVVVTSEDPAARAAISRFRGSHDRWIVAVNMVSEGIDIPRLCVGVYASKARTPLFFRQVVGRLVRMRPDEEVTAELFIPAVPKLMEHARAIEEELRHQLIEEERKERDSADRDDQQQEFDIHVSLSASEAIFDRAIFNGVEVSELERIEAERVCRESQIPLKYAVQLAPALRRLQPRTAETPHTSSPRPPRHRKEKLKRTAVKNLVNAVAGSEGVEPKQINTELIARGFPARAKATLEQLDAIEQYLTERLGHRGR